MYKIAALLLVLSLTFKNELPAQTQAITVEETIVNQMQTAHFEKIKSQYAKISEGRSMYHFFTFLPEYTYELVAFSEEEGVLDTDLYLLDTEKDTMLFKDTDTEALCLMRYTPSQKQQLKIVITNYNSEVPNHDYPCKLLIFARKRGR